MNVSTSALGVRRRRANNVDDEENAATLKLGPEFSLKQINHNGEEVELTALNLSEARLLIRTALRDRTGQSQEDEEENEVSNIALAPNGNEVLHKTLNYLSSFARFKSHESAEAVEKLLSSDVVREHLHPFEIAQLGSLTCDDVEEAKTLIPSLSSKINDDELKSLLSELGRLETNY